MTADLPLVTIGIPTYRRPEYLREALASAVAQTHGRLEILVSDNAADPAARAVVEAVGDPRVRYWPQPENLGMVGNWNALLRAARGEYFLLLSDDDLLEPGGVEALVRLMLGDPGRPALVYGAVVPFGLGDGPEPDRHRPPPEREDARRLVANFVLWGRPTFACGLLFRLTPELRAGGYDPAYRLLFDADFWMRAVRAGGPVPFTPAVVGRYRVHPEAESAVAGRAAWADEMDRLVDARLRDGSLAPSEAGLAHFLNHARERAARQPLLRRWRDLVGLARAHRVPPGLLAAYLVKTSVPRGPLAALRGRGGRRA